MGQRRRSAVWTGVLLNSWLRMKKAGARPPIAKFVKKVKAQIDVKATCFL